MKRKLKKKVFVTCSIVIAIAVLAKIFLFTFSNYNMKYVLIWSHPNAEPFAVLGPGSETFHKRKCPIQNCYVTSDRNFFNNVTTFDAILFHGPNIVTRNPKMYLPKKRSAHQSYIFTSMESSHNYPVPDSRYNDVFNFSWTYKLNSDISFKYMVIKDREGRVIGPNATIDWMKIGDMLPINDTIQRKLAKKSLTASWIVSNCKTYSGRERLAAKIVTELLKYNLRLDVYGACGFKHFPKKFMNLCLRILQRDYYFYFAFENSFSEDYVTEKLLNALRSYAVPIVYGAANYTRFMPNGIYLNAKNMSVHSLVKEMVLIIKHKQRYNNFFKWHNHYTYHHPEESPDTDPYCSLCSFINNVNQSKVNVIKNFFKWWNPVKR